MYDWKLATNTINWEPVQRHVELFNEWIILNRIDKLWSNCFYLKNVCLSHKNDNGIMYFLIDFLVVFILFPLYILFRKLSNKLEYTRSTW